MKQLLIASTNRGKFQELQSLLSQLEVELISPAQLNLKLEVLEDGKSYAENAALKAVAYSQASGLLTLADDSGLEVDALGGQPGIHSARYSPKPGATDADRRAFLLEHLLGLPRPWTAHFHCTVALLKPGTGLQLAEGICAGEIIPTERGSNGFGYDPIFYIPTLQRTMAELSMQEKNLLSHRARAVIAALPLLASLLRLA
jgi:XTP/dITP diphosphohydrolase